MSEKVSVVIPIYKVEDLLERCIDSVLDQEYKNLEIILVDDGSPDNSGKICDTYASVDSRVKVIHKTNGGLSDARNTGMKNATGEYITFLDSDDWIEPDFISYLLSIMKINDAEIGACNFLKKSNIIRNNSEIVNEKICIYSNIEALSALCGDLYLQLTIACGKIYKRELFSNIHYPVGKIHEDEFTTYKVLYKANRIAYTSRQLLNYWQRSESIMNGGFNVKNRFDAIEAFEERAEFFNDLNMIELYSKTLRMLFWIYRDVINHLRENDSDSLKKYEEKYMMFLLKLKKSNQSFLFRTYYNLYHKFPDVSNMIYNYIYKRR